MSADQKMTVVIEANSSNVSVTTSQTAEQFVLMQQNIENVFKSIQQSFDQSFKSIQQTINNTFKQVPEKIDGIQKKLPLFAMMVGAIQPAFNMLGKLGGAIKDTINSTAAWSTEVNNLAQTLGTSTIEAGGLAQALKGLNISTDSYKGAVFNLQRSLNNQEDAFKKNGIATRNARGELLGIQQIMMNTIGRLKEMKPGYDANALAMMAFGRSAKELQGLMRLSNEKVAEGIDKLKELGITVDADGTKAANAYREAMRELGETIQALKIRIGEALLPALTNTAKVLASMVSILIGPISKGFDLLNVILKSTSIQLGIVAVAVNLLRTRMIDATGSAKGLGTALQAAFAEKIKASLMALVSPWNLLIVAIAGAGYAVGRWATAASRAASENSKLVNTAIQNRNEFLRYSEQLKEVDETLKKSKEGTKEHQEATARKAVLIGQLNNIYPGFNKFLKDEAGNYRSLAEAIKLANDAQINELKIKRAKLREDFNDLGAELNKRSKKTYGWNPLDIITVPLNNKKIQDIKDARKQIKENYDALGETILGLKAATDSFNADSGKGDGGQKEKIDLLRQYAQELKKLQLEEAQFAEEQGRRYDFGLEKERDFWQEKLSSVKAGSKEEASIKEKIQDLEFNIIQKRVKDNEDAAKKLRDIENSIADHKLSQHTKTIDGQRSALDHEVTMKRMSVTDRLAAETAFAESEFELQERRLQEQYAAAEAGSVQQQAIYNQIEALYADHQLKLQEIEQRAAEERRALLEMFFAPLEQGFQDALGGMLNGSMSLAEGWQRTLKGMGQMLDQFIVRSVMSWIKGEQTKDKATGVSVAKRVATEAWGIMQTVAKTAWGAMKNIAIKGYEAAAGAYKALVGIPYVGPFIAPAAAAVALAAVVALGSKISSAAGGWGQVPYDQIAAIHKDEMVLPAKYANPMRDMLEGGEMPGVGAGGEGMTNITINATDAQSVARLFMENGPALVKSIKAQSRNFAGLG